MNNNLPIRLAIFQIIFFITVAAGCTTISSNGAGTQGQPVLHLTDNSTTQSHVNASAGWTPRFGQSSVVMPDGSIVLMGGFALERINNTPQFIDTNDVWRSTDNGTTWALMTADAGWSPRYGQGSVVTKDGRIVLIGDIHETNDIWSSTDNGATWEIVNPHAEWSSRAGESCVILPDGKIILTGGSTQTSPHPPFNTCNNDVWQSTDNGTTWKLINSNAEWPARAVHSSVVMPDGTIVLMGGSVCGSGTVNDVWRSKDGGLTWKMVNASAGWQPRVDFSTGVTKNGSIVLMGGTYTNSIVNDVWRSNDEGSTWTEVNASAGWSARDSQSAVITPDDKIILMGGKTGEINLTRRVLNDVWESDDYGATWKLVKKSA
jgi:BNR repeat-like domain/Galactose oxidase, central domain